MKINRQLGILSILLQTETVTAPYLSEIFEVSRRTINRDIEDLCKAGIPIVTRQGKDGGISIIDGYKINRTMLTCDEMGDILAGLRSLDSVNGTNRYGQLMEKLSIGSSDFLVGNQSVLIDLSSWYKDSLAPKIEITLPDIEIFDYTAFKTICQEMIASLPLAFQRKITDREQKQRAQKTMIDLKKDAQFLIKIPKTYSGKIVLQTKEEIVHVTDVDFQGNLGISTNTGEILLEQDMN